MKCGVEYGIMLFFVMWMVVLVFLWLCGDMMELNDGEGCMMVWLMVVGIGDDGYVGFGCYVWCVLFDVVYVVGVKW